MSFSPLFPGAYSAPEDAGPSPNVSGPGRGFISQLNRRSSAGRQLSLAANRINQAIPEPF